MVSTTRRTIRVPDDAWGRWQDAAAARRVSVAQLVHLAVEREIASAVASVPVDREAFCRKYGHDWERLLPRGAKPFCRRCGLEVHS